MKSKIESEIEADFGMFSREQTEPKIFGKAKDWVEKEIAKIPKNKLGKCECCGKIIGGIKVKCVECSMTCTKEICKVKEMY